MKFYIVKPQDTVDTIAETFAIPAQNIIFVNQLVYPYALAVGQALLIPVVTPPLSWRPPLVSFGYAYPYISRWVLEQTLPYLNELYVFSYGFTPEGNLLPPLLDDQWMIDLAKDRSVLPILTLTPFGPDGRFNNALISAVVRNPAAKQNLISQLLQTLQAKDFQGVDVDFEYIRADDRDAFTSFVSYLADALHASGYQISVALAPKTSANQPGLLYEGKDYAAIAAVSDSVLLMTYEWGYTYGPPMAVAPINKVDRKSTRSEL